jgi:hypothetical protein
MLLLGVFTMAITPWSTLHHHEKEAVSAAENNCTHRFHVKTQQDTCLICAAHFEKNYTAQVTSHVVYLSSSPIAKLNPVLSSAFIALISTSLRGPPSRS